MKKKKENLTSAELISARVRQFYNHCKKCDIWTENEKLNEDMLCTRCAPAIIPED